MGFEAKFSGTACAQCDERIVEGQLVEHNFDNEIQHVVCPGSLDYLMDEPVCPQCFMTLPRTGLCDCRE